LLGSEPCRSGPSAPALRGLVRHGESAPCLLNCQPDACFGALQAYWPAQQAMRAERPTLLGKGKPKLHYHRRRPRQRSLRRGCSTRSMWRGCTARRRGLARHEAADR
jgi:hypothetical protein